MRTHVVFSICCCCSSFMLESFATIGFQQAEFSPSVKLPNSYVKVSTKPPSTFWSELFLYHDLSVPGSACSPTRRHLFPNAGAPDWSNFSHQDVFWNHDFSAFLADGDIIPRCSPCDAVFLVIGDGVRAGAFTHAVDLHDWNVEAHEVFQSVFGDGGSAGEENPAAVQSQQSTHLLIHQTIGQCEAPRHHVLPATEKVKSNIQPGQRLHFYFRK